MIKYNLGCGLQDGTSNLIRCQCRTYNNGHNVTCKRWGKKLYRDQMENAATKVGCCKCWVSPADYKLKRLFITCDPVKRSVKSAIIDRINQSSRWKDAPLFLAQLMCRGRGRIKRLQKCAQRPHHCVPPSQASTQADKNTASTHQPRRINAPMVHLALRLCQPHNAVVM